MVCEPVCLVREPCGLQGKGGRRIVCLVHEPPGHKGLQTTWFANQARNGRTHSATAFARGREVGVKRPPWDGEEGGRDQEQGRGDIKGEAPLAIP